MRDIYCKSRAMPCFKKSQLFRIHSQDFQTKVLQSKSWLSVFVGMLMHKRLYNRPQRYFFTELTSYCFKDLDKVKLPYVLQSIHSLIGYFNLDPNRVLDIILEAFERQPSQVNFKKKVIMSDYLQKKVFLRNNISQQEK